MKSPLPDGCSGSSRAWCSIALGSSLRRSHMALERLVLMLEALQLLIQCTRLRDSSVHRRSNRSVRRPHDRQGRAQVRPPPRSPAPPGAQNCQSKPACQPRRALSRVLCVLNTSHCYLKVQICVGNTVKRKTEISRLCTYFVLPLIARKPHLRSAELAARTSRSLVSC